MSSCGGNDTAALNLGYVIKPVHVLRNLCSEQLISIDVQGQGKGHGQKKTSDLVVLI